MKATVNLILLVSCVCLALAGCATAPGKTYPGYRERTQTDSAVDVKVAVSTLSADESAAVYGVPLAKRQIQPIWIEVVNRGDFVYWLLFQGIDPNYYAASEAAEVMVSGGSERDLAKMTRQFEDLAFHNPVLPGETVSGFVLTPLHEAVRLVQIDLYSEGRSHSFSLITPVPGLRVDYEETAAARARLLATVQATDYTDDTEFRAALTALPCCTTNKGGTKDGDPLNLVVVGGVDDAFPAFVRRGWTTTEVTWFGSVMRMVTSAVSGDRYAYAPISNLYLYDRPQDIALQKARDNIHQRNHLRLWRSPMTYHGKPVWVGQISRDIGSRMTIHSPTFTTHKIDPDVDLAATALAQDLAYSQNLGAIGFVGGVGVSTRSAPRRNLTTDPYYTDGRRTVLIFDSEPTSLDEITILPWETGEDLFIQQAVEGESP